ncbi:MAG: hypothetical protein MUP61_08415, partial [Burkholderiales bacterium]|nr:hypothetical protein [Burkholderiales bacterium]
MTAPAGLCAALLCAFLLPAAALAADAAGHEMTVRIEPASHVLQGRDSISFDAPRAATLVLSTRFRIDALAADGRPVEATPRLSGGVQQIGLPAARRIEVSWSGTLAALDRSLDHRDTLTYDQPASGEAGTFLPAGSGWYPAVDGALERYTLELDLPADQRGLVPGRLIEEKQANARYIARFEFRHPAEG